MNINSPYLLTRPELPQEFLILRVLTDNISRDLVLRDTCVADLDVPRYLETSFTSALTDTPTDLTLYMGFMNRTAGSLVCYFRNKEFGSFSRVSLTFSEISMVSAVLIHEKDGKQSQLLMSNEFLERITNPGGEKAIWASE